MSKNTLTTVNRQSRLEWVNADDLKVNPVAQREFRPAWANTILSNFDMDKFQVPHVNRRADGSLFIMEGQHSVWAFRQWAGEGQQVQAWVYDDLSEAQEAEYFLSLNNKKSVDAMAKFKAAVTAGRPSEVEIDRIARNNGCHVSQSSRPNAITAVSALTGIYNRHGAEVLTDTLRIIRESFAEGGYERPVLLGISMVLARYPDLDQDRLISRLAAIRIGWKGLVQKTSLIKEQMDVVQADAAAAAVVEFYNKGRGRRLPNWWRSAEVDAA